MTFAVTNLALSTGSNGFNAVLTDPFGRAATSTVSVAVRDAGYGYDANGNLTNDGERAYAWDEENRLIEVRDLVSGQPLLRSRYDGLSRRRERVQWEGGVGSTNRYVYDNWNVLRVLDGADNVLESYVHGPDLSGTIGGAGGIGGILSVAHAGGPWRFYHADGNGNIALITDPSEQETARIEYDPFGRVLINTASQPVRYQFSSKEYDASVGVNYYGYRFYSPGLGRWLSRDPIGERGGLNLYAMAANSAVHAYDPLGLCVHVYLYKLDCWWNVVPWLVHGAQKISDIKDLVTGQFADLTVSLALDKLIGFNPGAFDGCKSNEDHTTTGCGGCDTILESRDGPKFEDGWSYKGLIYVQYILTIEFTETYSKDPCCKEWWESSY